MQSEIVLGSIFSIFICCLTIEIVKRPLLHWCRDLNLQSFGPFGQWCLFQRLNGKKFRRIVRVPALNGNTFTSFNNQTIALKIPIWNIGSYTSINISVDACICIYVLYLRAMQCLSISYLKVVIKDVESSSITFKIIL